MKILFHPQINWEGWQAIKQSPMFQCMSSGEQLCLIDRLPLRIWQQEHAVTYDSAHCDGRLGMH